MDGAYVAVKFPGTSSSMSNQSTAAPTDSDPSSLLQDCRLLRIDELQVQTLIRLLLGLQTLTLSSELITEVCFCVDVRICPADIDIH